jgi:SAM-dependent methyltransferase
MQLEVGDLASFYETPIGQSARRAILRRIKLIWPDVAQRRVLGFGFATPYLAPWMTEAERVIAFMPAQQGVVAWPQSKNLAALGDETALPFPDSMFDRILVVHGLEGAESARPVLRQLWRVLAPEGHILIVAPNRASLWAQLAQSPFAFGRPYHRQELDALLKASMFEPRGWDRALHVPPFRSRRLIGTGTTWENFGRRGWPALAGVHLVDASKSLGAPLMEPSRPRGKRVLAPAHVPNSKEALRTDRSD